jgi:hypothetical protein
MFCSCFACVFVVAVERSPSPLRKGVIIGYAAYDHMMEGTIITVYVKYFKVIPVHETYGVYYTILF